MDGSWGYVGQKAGPPPGIFHLPREARKKVMGGGWELQITFLFFLFWNIYSTEKNSKVCAWPLVIYKRTPHNVDWVWLG
jgi:hypothetical protein